MEANFSGLGPTHFGLEHLLGLVEEHKTEAEAVRDSVDEAPIRARILVAIAESLVEAGQAFSRNFALEPATS